MHDLGLSVPSERLIGFTVPNAGRFFVCDHDEVWLVVVGGSVSVEQTDHAPYDIAERPDFVGWGKDGGAPILALGVCAISYDFDPRASSVKVFFTDGVNKEEIDFPTFSGDWFGASLSREGDLVVLAEPYRISVYRTMR